MAIENDSLLSLRRGSRFVHGVFEMRATPADTARALGLACLLHAALLTSLLIGMSWTHGTAASGAAPTMAADLVDSDSLSDAMQLALNMTTAALPQSPPVTPVVPPPEPPREARPEPPLERSPEPPSVRLPEQAQAEPLPLEHERIPELETAVQAAGDGAAIPPEASAPPAKEPEAAEPLFGDRKQRVLAMRRASRAEQTITQIIYALGRKTAGTTAPSDPAKHLNPPTPSDDVEGELWPRYEPALLESNLRDWISSGNRLDGEPCRTAIETLPDGEIVELPVDALCPFDGIVRRSIEDMALRAHPRPNPEYDVVLRQTFSASLATQDR